MMRNGLLIFCLVILLIAAGCSAASSTSPPPAGNTATPAATAVASAVPVAPPATGPSAVAGAKVQGDPKTQGSLPPALWDRFRRGLTDEEIRRLPPETRDMILRAQGKLPATPAPSPKKK